MRSAERTLEKRCEMRSTERPSRSSPSRSKSRLSARASSAAGRLVEDHERRVAEERARERDALPLADREVVAAGELAAEHRLVALGEPLEEVVRVGARGGRDDVVERVDPLVPPHADVLARREQVALEVLEDDRDRGAELVAVDLGDVDVVPEHAPVVGPVEPRDDLRERRLAGAVLADERDHLAPLDLERDAVERGPVRSRGR